MTNEKKSGTPFLVMGDEVSLFGEEEHNLPIKYVIARDVDGRHVPHNEVFFMEWIGKAYDDEPVAPSAAARAKVWYGDKVSLNTYAVVLPSGPWEQIDQINEIRYRRLGDHAGAYEHKFRIGIPLLRSKGKERGWKIVLPKNCIVDERGFVDP